MLYKGVFKRIAPFFLTFAAGLFIASFFITVASPSFNLPSRGSHKARHYRNLKMENRELRDENEKLKRQIEELRRTSNWDHTVYEIPAVPPVELEAPPPPPIPMRRAHGFGR